MLSYLLKSSKYHVFIHTIVKERLLLSYILWKLPVTMCFLGHNFSFPSFPPFLPPSLPLNLSPFLLSSLSSFLTDCSAQKLYLSYDLVALQESTSMHFLFNMNTLYSVTMTSVFWPLTLSQNGHNIFLCVCVCVEEGSFDHWGKKLDYCPKSQVLALLKF